MSRDTLFFNTLSGNVKHGLENVPLMGFPSPSAAAAAVIKVGQGVWGAFTAALRVCPPPSSVLAVWDAGAEAQVL